MSSELSTAYLLVSHGSRDPRPQAAVDQLAQLVAHQLVTRLHSRAVQFPWVSTACLELSPLPLHQQIIDLSQQAWGAGLQRLCILPLFLLPGTHVQVDMPTEVEQAQAKLPGGFSLELLPHLGSHPGLRSLLAQQMHPFPAPARILLAHGSRRAGGNQPVETLAAQVEGVAAYWSVSPSLATRVEDFVAAGYQQVGIVPYFLFAGGITDAIAERVHQLAQQFVDVRLHLAEPIGVSDELATLVTDLILG